MSDRADSEEALLASIDPTPSTAEAQGGESGEGAYEPIGQAIARRVRDAILDGRLPPGTRVRQEPLARRFGVSRIPVREALRELESQGLVTLVPHSGARVAGLDRAEQIELHRIREALEPVAIAASAPLLEASQLAALHRLADQLAAAVDDEPRWLALDRSFHLGSYAAAGMPRLLQMIDELWDATQGSRRAHRALLSAADFDVVDRDHRHILDALDRRDPVDAEARTRSHIRAVRLALSGAR